MNLTDAMTEYATDALPADTPDALRAPCQRAYMAGALEILGRIGRGESRHALLQEVLDYGRTVGSKVETAR